MIVRRLLTLALVLPCVGAPAVPVGDAHHRVLILHSFRQSLPVNSDWYSGIVRGFEAATDLRIDIDIETLDLPRFSDAGYIADSLEVLHRKYTDNVFERRARQALKSFEDRVQLTWLRGMPLEELLAAVKRLPADVVLLYVLQLEDRTGGNHFPFQKHSRA